MTEKRRQCSSRSALLGALLLLMPTLLPARGPAPGLYFDPVHDGHGFDLQPVGTAWVVVFYSYDDDGSPEWLLAVADQQDGRFAGVFERFDYQAGRLPAQQSLGQAGPFSIDFEAGCVDGQALFDWQIDGEAGQWCVQPLLPVNPEPTGDFTGLWYAGEADAGWGLSLDFQGGDGPAAVQVLFYYDSEGKPRWSLGLADGDDLRRADHDSFRGYCRTCTPTPVTFTEAGLIEHRLQVVDGWPVGDVDIDVTFPDSPGGDWLRQDSPLVPLSDPLPGLIPLPDRIEPEQALVITDVDVVPLSKGIERLTDQTVVLSDGFIRSVGPRGGVAPPAGAIRIDGRGLTLGPGLADVHTHFTFGGQIPMEEAGTLFIANGVTSVLNMGDSGNLDLPGMDDRFDSGELIGPRVFAGQAVYGPADGRAAHLTVSTPTGATSFAQAIASQGYDYIKVYNDISPEVMTQFILEGERLGLPVIGHLPKTQSMQASLDQGLRLVAHVAEVYFTYFGNNPRDDLLDPAAELLIGQDVFLSDTLTASESFAAMFGGNEENFETFSTRNGIQYQPPSFRNAWRSFFDSGTLQPAGSSPGQLDGRLAFFKQMTRHFHDAGVKLLLGTDSPGHTGVISGFSVHEHLRIYAEIGLTPLQSWEVASRNAGAFFDQTLQRDVSVGRVEPGLGADLILVEGDPLRDHTRLARPLAVISRGRLYSRALLDQALQDLDDKYPGPFTGGGKSSASIPEHGH